MCGWCFGQKKKLTKTLCVPTSCVSAPFRITCLLFSCGSSHFRCYIWQSKGVFISKNLLAMQQFGPLLSCLITWNGCKWNWHKPVCFSVIVCGCEHVLCVCVWTLWVSTANVHAIDVDNMCVPAVCSHLMAAINVCLGLKARVSVVVRGGHLNRI